MGSVYPLTRAACQKKQPSFKDCMLENQSFSCWPAGLAMFSRTGRVRREAKLCYCEPHTGLLWPGVEFCQELYRLETHFHKLSKHLLRESYATEYRLIPAYTMPDVSMGGSVIMSEQDTGK